MSKKPFENTICFFNTYKNWGGGEKWHFEAASYLKAKGYNVIAVTNKKSALYKKFQNTNIITVPIEISNLSFLNPFKIKEIRKTFRIFNVNTVIMNLPSDLKTAGPAAKKTGVKKIIYRRGSAIPIRNTSFNRYLFGSILTDIVANSETTKKSILKNNPHLFPENKIHIIHNALKIEEYKPDKTNKISIQKSNKLVLGTAARLSREKGIHYLIETASILKNKNIDFTLLIAGKGKLMSTLKKYSKKLNVQNNIKFLGFVNNIPEFMSSLDIFLHSHFEDYHEGFGFVMIEAMAMKIPVIAYNSGSPTEIIINNETGLLTNPFDPADMAEKIIYLNKNRNLLLEMGKKGRIRVEENFDTKIAMNKLEQVMNSN